MVWRAYLVIREVFKHSEEGLQALSLSGTPVGPALSSYHSFRQWLVDLDKVKDTTKEKAVTDWYMYSTMESAFWRNFQGSEKGAACRVCQL